MSILAKMRAELDKLGAALVDVVTGAKDDIHSAVTLDANEAKAAAAHFMVSVSNPLEMTFNDFFMAGAAWMAERAKAAATSAAAAPVTDEGDHASDETMKQDDPVEQAEGVTMQQASPETIAAGEQQGSATPTAPAAQ